jgi:hypothetical protein
MQITNLSNDTTFWICESGSTFSEVLDDGKNSVGIAVRLRRNLSGVLYLEVSK